MTTFQRSPEYRKQSRTFFLTNTAAVRKQVEGVSAVSAVHAPTIMVIVPTTTSVIVPGVSALSNASSPSGTVDVVTSTVFEEDYSTYADTAAYRNNVNGWYTAFTRPDDQYIDTAITDPEVTSGQTLRWEWPAVGGGNACIDYSIGNQIRQWQDGTTFANLSPGPQQVWIEWRIRFDSAWNTTADASFNCTSNPDHKMLRVLVGENGFDPFFEIKNGHTPGHWWNFAAPPDPDAQIQREDAHTSNPNADNEWNVIRLHMKLSTDESTPDGRIMAEVNGRRMVGKTRGFTGEDLIIARSDPRNGTGAFWTKFRAFLFGRNRNNRRSDAQKMWISRVRLYDADPGWVEGYPNQPINHTAPAIIDSGTPGSGAGWTIETGSENFLVSIPGEWKSAAAKTIATIASGTSNGATVVRSVSPVTGTKKSLYFALYVEPESNFEGNTLNRILSFEHENKDGTTFNSTSVNLAGLDSGSLDLQMYLSNLQGDPLAASGVRNLNANITAAPIKRNRLYIIEGRVIQNTPGVSDGEVHMWVDGAQRLKYTNIRWSDATGGGDNKWTEVQLNVVNGLGPNATVANTYQINYDHLYVTVN